MKHFSLYITLLCSLTNLYAADAVEHKKATKPKMFTFADAATLEKRLIEGHFSPLAKPPHNIHTELAGKTLPNNEVLPMLATAIAAARKEDQYSIRAAHGSDSHALAALVTGNVLNVDAPEFTHTSK